MQSRDPEIQEECTDILNDLFKRFASILIHNPQLCDKDELTKLLLGRPYVALTVGVSFRIDQLRIDSLSLRKKTTYCLGSLSMLLSNK